MSVPWDLDSRTPCVEEGFAIELSELRDRVEARLSTRVRSLDRLECRARGVTCIILCTSGEGARASSSLLADLGVEGERGEAHSRWWWSSDSTSSSGEGR